MCWQLVCDKVVVSGSGGGGGGGNGDAVVVVVANVQPVDVDAVEINRLFLLFG